MLNAQSLDAPQMHKLKIQYSFCCAVVRALLLNNHLIHAAFLALCCELRRCSQISQISSNLASFDAFQGQIQSRTTMRFTCVEWTATLSFSILLVSQIDSFVLQHKIITTPRHVGRLRSHHQFRSSKGDEDNEKAKKKPQAIVDSNVPSVVKTKRGGYASDVLKNRLERKKAVAFERPPERPSGYYEDRVCTLKDGHELSFNEYYIAENENDLVVCLNNLADFKNNDKSMAVLEYCKRHGRNFLTYDWFGRGGSSGRLMEATISRWTSDTIEFLDKEALHVKGGIAGVKAVLVGVGVGGWVAVLVAIRRPDLVRGIVGLSADPDFTEDLLWSKLPLEEKNAIMKDGFREVTWGNRQEVYPITSTLIEDGRKNLVLRGGPNSLEIMCPVRLIHSLDDEEVPYSVPLRLANAIQTKNIRIFMPKIGGHDLQQDYRPAGPGWVDPEDSSVTSLQSKRTIKSALDDCLDQVFFSTMEVDASDSW